MYNDAPLMHKSDMPADLSAWHDLNAIVVSDIAMQKPKKLAE
jgi:hypothetical protein